MDSDIEGMTSIRAMLPDAQAIDYLKRLRASSHEVMVKIGTGK